MKEKLLNVLFGIMLVIGAIAFIAWMQTDYEMCDGLGFPVCTSSDP